MAMTVHEAFVKGTETFNAHDIDGFTSVLADDVVFHAPGGMSGEGKAACAGFFAGWFGAFPDLLENVDHARVSRWSSSQGAVATTTTRSCRPASGSRCLASSCRSASRASSPGSPRLRATR